MLGINIERENKMEIWDFLRHFNKNENWGNHEKINGFLLLALDELRHRIGHEFIIHNAYAQTGHSDDSLHYKGSAVDYHICTKSFLKTCNDVILCLSEMQIADRVGLGIYPDWNNPGFHLDSRGYQARWGRLENKYISIEEAMRNIKS